MTTSYIADLVTVLKNKYQGTINELSNYECSMLDLFEESDQILMGGASGVTSSLVITFRTQGNKSATVLAEGAGVAAARKIYYAKFNIGGATLNGTCQFTYQASEAAPGDKDLAWMKEADEQTSNLMKEIALRKDIWLYTGGEVKGLLNERKNSSATAGADTNEAAVSPAFVLEYAGSVEPFAGVVLADETTWVRVQIARLGNYIPTAQFATMPGLPYEFSYASAANGMIEGTSVGLNLFVGNVATDANGGYLLSVFLVDENNGVKLDLLGTTGKETIPGYAFALAIAPDVGLYAGGAWVVKYGNTAYPDGTDPYVLWQQEPNGALTNLFAPTVFGCDRSSGTVYPIPDAKFTRLQPFAFTLSKVAPQARTALTTTNVKQRFQDMLNIIQTATGEAPDMLVTNIFQKSQYLSVTTPTATFLVNPEFNKTPGDPAVKHKTGKMWNGTTDQYAFAGIRIGTSKNCPDGMWFFWKKSSMKWTKTKAGGEWLTQGNGSILFNPINPSTGLPLTQYAATWIEIFNTYCQHPQYNGAMVGMNCGQ